MTVTLEKPVKQVMFVCPGGYELNIVMKSEDFIAVEGRAIKVHPRRITFRKRPFGGEYRGEYLASDPEEINFLRKHNWYKKGAIPQDQPIFSKTTGQIMGYKQSGATGVDRSFWEVDFNPEEPRKVPEIVHRSGDSNPDIPEPQEPIPTDTIPKPTRARIAKSLRKK